MKVNISGELWRPLAIALKRERERLSKRKEDFSAIERLEEIIPQHVWDEVNP